MGVFDFLYKSPNRSKYESSRRGRRGYGPPGSTPGYRPRTTMYVDQKTSLPLDDHFSDRHYGGYPQRSYRNASNRTPHSKTNNNSGAGGGSQPKPTSTKQYHLDAVDSPKLVQNDDDDYTRLKRLENQIDSQITRHNECAEEMDSIRKTLNSIHKEFKPEFQQELSGVNKNKHVVEVGERILAKLESMNDWQPNPITISVRTPPTPLKTIPKDKTMDAIPEHSDANQEACQEPNDPNGEDASPKQEFRGFTPYIDEYDPKMYPNSSKGTYTIARARKHSDANHDDQEPNDPNGEDASPKQEFRDFTSYMKEYDPKTLETIKVFSSQMNQDSSKGAYTIARARYAVVDNPTSSYHTFTPTVTNTLSRYPTRPSLVEQQYGLPKTSSPYPMKSPPPPPPSAMMTVDDALASPQYSPVTRSFALPPPPPQSQPPLYLNMAQSIHSDHPIIEDCLRKIQELRPRIKLYRSQHRMGVYKQFNEEIITLMHQLERLDCSKDEVFEQDKQIALTELHNLSGMLERSIDCQDHDCDVCNSFVNCKPEIAV